MQESIEELFPTTSEPVRAILAELRTVVCGALPEATEIFYHGALGYGLSQKGFDRILYVQPQNGYVNLGFFFGLGVDDPTGLIAPGTGKRMRHIKVRSVLAAHNPALVPLVRDAWKKGLIGFEQLQEDRKKQRAGQG